MGALNVDQRFGLRPVRYKNGNPWNGQATKYYVHSTYATALFIGDPVDYTTETDYHDTTAKYPTVQVATLADGNYTLGPIVAVEPLRTDLTKQYLPASTGGYVYVADDPDLIFHIRADAVAAPTKLWCGQNAIMIAAHTGDTATGISGMELDSGTDPPEANASNMLLILNLARLEGNTLATRAIWEVMISMHRHRGFAAGILGVTAT